MKKNLPLVTIIVPVRNGEKTIHKAVESIMNIDHENYELIVINDGSNDNTSELLKCFKDRIKYVYTECVGASEARNLGIRTARGEYLAFTDSDCIVDKSWITNLLEGFSFSDNIAGVGGDQLSPNDDTDFGKTLSSFMKSVGFVIDYVKNNENKLIVTEHNASCNVMYKKEVFERVGLFAGGLWPGEDVEFDHRVTKAGYKLVNNPKAIVFHYRPDNFKKFMKMMYNYGKVQSILIKKYGFFRKIHFEPILVLTFILLIIVFAKDEYILLALAAVPVLAGFTIFLVKSRSIVTAIKNIILAFTAIVSWNTGFARGLFISKNIIKSIGYRK